MIRALRRSNWLYLVFALLLVAGLIVSLGVGAVPLTPAEVIGVLRGAPARAADAAIVWDFRLARVLLVSLSGAALAAAGAGFQGLFRNPLADPYLIGVASGAGLGAVLAMSLASLTAPLLGLFTIPAAAFAGALITVALVYFLARSGGAVPTTTLILAGVAVGSFASALTSFLMLRSQGELYRALAWLLGGAALGGWEPVLAALPYVALGLGVLGVSGHALNVLQFGDEQAQQLGIRVERARALLLLSASLATAAAVSFSGIIGFVGLIVPHVARLLWGPDYRRLIPLSILGGATLLLLADLLARLILRPEALPVGVVTALGGAPFFLWVLKRSQRLGR